MGRGLHLGRIGGVEVVLDWSLMIIFVLITVGLGSGLFAQWHADWGAPLIGIVRIDDIRSDDGRVFGLLTHENVLKWLALYGEEQGGPVAGGASARGWHGLLRPQRPAATPRGRSR